MLVLIFQFIFQVKLTKFDDKQKVALIKEVKNLLEGFNLVQAKKFVESAPTIVKADIAKDEAEKLKEALTKVGAIIEIEQLQKLVYSPIAFSKF